MVDNFTSPIPSPWLENTEITEWARDVTLLLDDLTRPEGALATSEATTEVVLTQQEKLDLMTVTQTVNLDTIESQISLIATGSPDYDISNDGTDRSFNADAAAGAISTPTVLPAEVENIRDAVLELADVLSTLIRDLKDKGILSV